MRLSHHRALHLEEGAPALGGPRRLRRFLQSREPPRPQANSSEATPTGRWRSFPREELLARDKASLDLLWLKDSSLTDLDNLPEPDLLAEEIIGNLEAGRENLRSVLSGLRG